MDPKGQFLLKLLFNEGETVCPANSKYGYHSIPLEKALDGQITLVPENAELPTRYCDSSELTLISINPIKGFRKDSNVTAFRTFLWEIDTGSIKEQLGYFKHLKIPLSAKVFSGNKSVHALTILSEEFPDEKTYRVHYEWALNILTMCDQNCKNPSRSVRIPGAYREEGKQRLISIGNRVKLADWMLWLNQYDHLKPQPKKKRELVEGENDYSCLSIWARVMLKKGIVFKNGRNKTWFALAYDFALAGFDIDKATEILLSKFEEESDFKEKELLICIASAYKTVEEDKD